MSFFRSALVPETFYKNKDTNTEKQITIFGGPFPSESEKRARISIPGYYPSENIPDVQIRLQFDTKKTKKLQPQIADVLKKMQKIDTDRDIKTIESVKTQKEEPGIQLKLKLEQSKEQAEEQAEKQAKEQPEEQPEEQAEERAEEQTEEQEEERAEEQTEEQTEEQAEEKPKVQTKKPEDDPLDESINILEILEKKDIVEQADELIKQIAIGEKDDKTKMKKTDKSTDKIITSTEDKDDAPKDKLDKLEQLLQESDEKELNKEKPEIDKLIEQLLQESDEKELDKEKLDKEKPKIDKLIEQLLQESPESNKLVEQLLQESPESNKLVEQLLQESDEKELDKEKYKSDKLVTPLVSAKLEKELIKPVIDKTTKKSFRDPPIIELEIIAIAQGTILYHPTQYEIFNPRKIRLGEDRLTAFFLTNIEWAKNILKNCADHPEPGFIHVFHVKKSIPNIMSFDYLDNKSSWSLNSLQMIEKEYCNKYDYKHAIKYNGIGIKFPEKDSWEYALCNPNDYLQYIESYRCESPWKWSDKYNFQ